MLVPELFALHLGAFLVGKYAHLNKAFVTVNQLRWQRILVGKEKKAHQHSFWRDGDEKRFVNIEVGGVTCYSALQTEVANTGITTNVYRAIDRWNKGKR